MKSRPVPTGPVGATRNGDGLAFRSADMLKYKMCVIIVGINLEPCLKVLPLCFRSVLILQTF